MLFPITTWHNDLDGRNATNTVFQIKMRRGLRYSKSIWAQEYYESKFKRNPINLLRKLLSEEVRRNMELMGHEIEVQQATIDGARQEEYRLLEATSMKVGYDGIFSEFTISQIRQKMMELSSHAKQFIVDNKFDIDKYGIE